jgi:hypothetical protein
MGAQALKECLNVLQMVLRLSGYAISKEVLSPRSIDGGLLATPCLF